METIFNLISTGLSYVVPLVVLLSLLIFVHELGHFLVAKWFGVKVEVFSLGFGPKILKHTRGETTYCLSAIPFGGYVKMFGEDITAEYTPEEKNRSFMHKPPMQRIWIALAGPIMNLLFAFIVFTLIGFVGESQIKNIVGDIGVNSIAYKTGFRSGDEILKIDNSEVTTWHDIEDKIASAAGKSINFTIKRDNALSQISTLPELKENENPISSQTQVGKITGLTPYFDIPLIVLKMPMNLEALGFKLGDIVTQVNTTKVNTLKEFKAELQKLASLETNKIYAQRADEKGNYKEIVFDINTKTTWNIDLHNALDDAETYISEVGAKTPAEAKGLKKFDKVIQINGVDIFDFEDIVEQVSKYQEGGSPLKVKFLRDFVPQEVEIVPNKTELTDNFGKTENRYTIGIRPMKGVHANTFVWRPQSLLEKFKFGIDKTWEWTEMTVMSFVRLFQNKVSPKNLGGFISIGQMAQKSWEIGLSAFLKIMGIISINLFVLNLLPIPILDGGHVVIYTAEILNGKPLNAKKVEIAQQVGMFIILFLMAFTLINDFSRILS